MKRDEILQTKQELIATVDRAAAVGLIRQFERTLSAPVNIEINVTLLDRHRQPRAKTRGFRHEGWHDGHPLRIDAPEDHYEFPPIQPGTTLMTGALASSIETQLEQCLDRQAATRLLRRIEEGKHPAQFELRAYSLFLVEGQGTNRATPLNLGRVRIGTINSREIRVVPVPDHENAYHRKEAALIEGRFNTVYELDDRIEELNALHAAVEHSPPARELLTQLAAELTLKPKRLSSVVRIADLMPSDGRPGVSAATRRAGLLSRLLAPFRGDGADSARQIWEYLHVNGISHFENPVLRSGTTVYCGTLRAELATKLRLRDPRLIANIDVDLL